MKIILLARSLNVGGAEVQLGVLARALHQRGHDVTVISFYSGGRICDELKHAGIRVLSMKKSGRWNLFPFFLRLSKAVKGSGADVLYSFLPVPNLVSAQLKRLNRRMKVVWGVRASHRDLRAYDWTWRWTDRLEARLSRIPDLIICNSEAGRTRCVERRFPIERVIVIPNGIDTDFYKFAPEKRDEIRASWFQDSQGAVAIGIVGRIDPVKQHDVFLSAARIVGDRHPEARFVIVGDGGTAIYRDELRAIAHPLNGEVVWTGEARDMPGVYSALDIQVLCSKSEGFPNVVAEAMACGTAVVTTDVGDAAKIVDQPKMVVPASDNGFQLAASIEELLASEGWRNRAEIRERIVSRYSVEQMVNATENALCDLCSATAFS